MRSLGIATAAGLIVLALSPSVASAARWCAGADCVFASRKQCIAATGRPDVCRRAVAARRVVVPAQPGWGVPAGPSAWPARPYNAAPGECYIDEGYGRFSSCSAGGAWN